MGGFFLKKCDRGFEMAVSFVWEHDWIPIKNQLVTQFEHSKTCSMSFIPINSSNWPFIIEPCAYILAIPNLNVLPSFDALDPMPLIQMVTCAIDTHVIHNERGNKFSINFYVITGAPDQHFFISNYASSASSFPFFAATLAAVAKRPSICYSCFYLVWCSSCSKLYQTHPLYLTQF